MKKELQYTLLAFFLFGISNFSYSQWTDYSLYGTSLTSAKNVKIVNSTTACIVGYNQNGFNFTGKIYRTINGGSTVSQVYSGGYVIHNVYFFDESNGIAVGETESNYRLLICKTSDGGASWTPSTISAFNSGYDITFTSPSVGFIAGDNGILTTTNGGTSWSTVVTSPSGSMGHLHFPTASTGYTISKSGSAVYKTTDGGNNWTSTSLGFTYQYSINNIYFINENIGFITPSSGNQIFRTTNGGVSWTTLNVGAAGNFYGLKFVSSTVGYAYGEKSSSGGCIYKTTDAGATWTLLRATSGVFSYYGFDVLGNFGIGAGLGGYSKTSNFNTAAALNDYPLEDVKINIYPSPSVDGNFQIKTDENIKNVSVVNSFGHKETFYDKTFNTSLKGLLIVIVNTNGKSYMEKVIVE